MQQPGALQAKRVLIAQLVLTGILAAVALFLGITAAFSVLIGGTVCMLANSVFAFWIFRDYRAQEPGSLVARFYGAEAIKLFLTLGLFAVAFAASDSLSLPALLSAYVAVQVLPVVFVSGWGGRKVDDKIR